MKQAREALVRSEIEYRARPNEIREFQRRVLNQVARRLSRDQEEYLHGGLERSEARCDVFENGAGERFTYSSIPDAATVGREHRVTVAVEDDIDLKAMNKTEFQLLVDGWVESGIDESLLYLIEKRPDEFKNSDVMICHKYEYCFSPEVSYKQVVTEMLVDDEAVDWLKGGRHAVEFAEEMSLELDEDESYEELDDPDAARMQHYRLFARANKQMSQITKEDLRIVQGALEKMGLYQDYTKRELAKRARWAAARREKDGPVADYYMQIFDED